MESHIPVTRTKILIPRRRAELLSRQRLLDLLYELLDDKLVIVAAPAGYGKTSLLIDFIHFANWPVCWYALDKLDQDPQRFLAHFIAALRLRFPAFGKSSQAALEGTTQDRLNLDSLISVIINDILENITEHFLFILDDYHLVEESKAVNYFINRFLLDIDENCHLIISSRILLTLPDMPLLVARSQVGGLSFAELAFQPDEIQRLLQDNYHHKVSDAEAAELARATEGWITGLLLSTQLIGGEITQRLRVAKVSGVGLYEYLAQQVLEGQPPAIQDFLLRTSLLEEFDARICAEVIEPALGSKENWGEIMETVLRHNLFILPVGEEGLFLRYHHLFRDFLQSRMVREHPEETRQIRICQAEYYLRQDEWERAYAVYQKLGKTDTIPDLIEKAGRSMMALGRLATLSDWLNELPDSVVETRPNLLILKGSVVGSRGDTRAGLDLLDRAIVLLRAVPVGGQLAYALVQRSITHRLRGEYQQALQDADEILAITQSYSSSSMDSAVKPADAFYAKGMALYYLGKANDAPAYLRDAIEGFQAAGDDQTVTKVLLDSGMVSKALGRYLDAENAYQKALAHFQVVGNLGWQANLLNNLGVLQHLMGNYESAASSFEKAIQYAEISAYPRIKAYALASIGDLYRDLEAGREAAEAYKQARQAADKVNERYLLFCLNLAEADLERMQGNTARAEELLKAAQAIADVGGSRSDQNLCRLGWAGLAIANQQSTTAIPDLETAVAFSDAEGYQAESLRGHLYLAVAYFRKGDSRTALAHLEHLSPLLASESMPLNCLVTTGKEVRPDLERMQEKSALKSITALLLEKVEHFESRQIPLIRQLVRRKNLVVPFAPPKLMVYALGKIQVKVADRVVTNTDWQTQTARDLLFLLLTNPDGFTKEEIGEIFWPDSSSHDLRLRFKNWVYRLRHATGKDVVLFEDDIYRFNRSLDYDYDVDNFNKEIHLANEAKEADIKIAHYQAALKLYKGAFLAGLEIQWFNAERERLHQAHIEVLMALAELNLAKNQPGAALTFCQRTLKEDRSYEPAHRLAMRIHATMGNRVLMVRQYEQCVKILMEEIHISPSVQTQNLYDELLR